MVNGRMFYACYGVAILKGSDGSDAPGDGTVISGVQSIGVSGGPSASSLLDVGRAKRKFIYYNKSDIQVTIERHITDGSSLIFENTTELLKTGNLGSMGDDLTGFNVSLMYGDDSLDGLTSGADSLTYRDCLLTSLSYNLTVDGPATESATFTTRRVEAGSGGFTIPTAGQGVTLKREHVTNITLPTEVNALFGVGALQSIELDLSINYNELVNHGKWPGAEDQGEQNSDRYVVLPVEPSISYTGIVRQGGAPEIPNPADFLDRTCRVVADMTVVAHAPSYFTWDLGQHNYMTDVSFSGGDTGGGNLTGTISYQNDRSEWWASSGATAGSYTSTLF